MVSPPSARDWPAMRCRWRLISAAPGAAWALWVVVALLIDAPFIGAFEKETPPPRRAAPPSRCTPRLPRARLPAQRRIPLGARRAALAWRAPGPAARVVRSERRFAAR